MAGRDRAGSGRGAKGKDREAESNDRGYQGLYLNAMGVTARHREARLPLWIAIVENSKIRKEENRIYVTGLLLIPFLVGLISRADK